MPTTPPAFNAAPDGPKFSIAARRGFRMWWAEPVDGRLKSVSNPYWWTPGWNQSQCMKHNWTDGDACAGLHHPTQRHSHIVGVCPEEPGCKYPTIDCSCGFYAYHARDHWSAGSSTSIALRVTGVVEAMGRMVIGSKGFRAEKALIVALTMPPLLGPDDDTTRELRAKISRRYSGAAQYLDEDTMLARWPLQGAPHSSHSDDEVF